MRLRWQDLYSEAELYKSAVRLYTKPLFSWRKALQTSSDGATLYEFARRGPERLARLHESLAERRFAYRPGVVVRHNFNGKRRTVYLYPWEERLVDHVLYGGLNRALERWLSPRSYAYRGGPFGIDRCQRGAARALDARKAPVYAVKRDVSDYFGSVDHEALRAQLRELVEPGDYLETLLEQRVSFPYLDGGRRLRAARGIPFGTAVACALANIHLTPVDRRAAAVPGVGYLRYGDDLLATAATPQAAARAAAEIDAGLLELKLKSKPSHELALCFGGEAPGFPRAQGLRHLGLEFRPDAVTRLSRDKARKLRNLFRFEFRRSRRGLARLKTPEERAKRAVELARRVLDRGVRNVAIIDYYLKHVRDEGQLRLLDRWLAEEVVSLACGGGHRKGHFRRLPYARLRELGLPSLVHRRRLILRRKLPSPFFVWTEMQRARGSQGTAASLRGRRRGGFSSIPAAAADVPSPVGEGSRLSMGVIENGFAEANPSCDQPSLGALSPQER